MKVWSNLSTSDLKANATDTEAPFLDIHLSVPNGFVSSKIYDKRANAFDFEIVNFPFLYGDVPRVLFLWCIHFATYYRFASLKSCEGLQRAK